MDLEEFAELTEEDIEHFLEDDSVDLSNRAALEISLPLTPNKKRDIRPRSVLPINEYLSRGGHPVADSGRIIRKAGNYSSVEDAPNEPKRQVGALLSMAEDSDSVPVKEWGSSSYSLNFEDDAERLLDYSRAVFIDKCIEALMGKDYLDLAKYLPEHLDGIEEERWEELRTEDYRADEDVFYSFDEDSFTDTAVVRDGVGRPVEKSESFIQYQLAVNNIREKDGGYVIKAAPEEIEISRAVAGYIRERDQLPVAD